MNIEQKLEILRKLDTKPLLAKLTEYEDELEQALTQQADFTSHNYNYIAARGSDCSMVKDIIAELSFQAPEVNEAGKKTTVAERDAWLQGQRKANQELTDALAQQREVAFLQDNCQIRCEMAKKHLEGTRAVLALKIAQINFLGSE